MIYDLHKDFGNSPNVHIFIRDVPLGIMPIGGESDRVPDFAVEIQGSLEHQERAVDILKSLDFNFNNISYTPAELLSKVVEGMCRSLLVNGCVVCKINRDTENNVKSLFAGLTPRWLFLVFGKYKIIGERDIWVITIPKELGGIHGHRVMLRELVRISLPAPFEFIKEERAQEQPIDFNLQRYIRKIEIFKLKLIGRWGWITGISNAEHLNKFYYYYRVITLKWAQACMREHIINEFNELFQRLHIGAEIIVKGLLTKQEILQLRQQMCEGKISFNDAFEKCSVS